MSLVILRTAVAGSLVGWAFLHLFGDVPYRAFFWSEVLFAPVWGTFSSIPWNDLVTSPVADSLIQGSIQSIGALLLLGGAVAALPPSQRSLRMSLPLATVILLGVTLLKFKGDGLRFGMLIEYAAQIVAPLLLFCILTGGITVQRSHQVARWAIALTFLGHGLYAIGYYPVPGKFIDMVINILGVSEDHARAFLFFAGAADIVVAISVFIAPFEKIAVSYAAVWGILTALARPVAQWKTGDEGLAYWTAEALCRLPHAGLPLFLLTQLQGHASARKSSRVSMAEPIHQS